MARLKVGVCLKQQVPSALQRLTHDRATERRIHKFFYRSGQRRKVAIVTLDGENTTIGLVDNAVCVGEFQRHRSVFPLGAALDGCADLGLTGVMGKPGAAAPDLADAAVVAARALAGGEVDVAPAAITRIAALH